jgi:hypothetical protein
MKVSKALQEVWDMKAGIDREYACLPDSEQVLRRLADSAKIAKRLGLQYAPVKRTPAVMVAESKGKYGKK